MISDEWIASVAKSIREQAEDASFLTEVYLDTENLEMMRSSTDILLLRSMVSNNPDVKIVASYLLMDIAMRLYDGSFWPHVSEEAGSDYNSKDQSDLYEVFRDGLELIGLRESLGIQTKRKLEMILIHTLVPDNKDYMFAFFDFISKYYKKVLDYQLPEDLDDRFDELSDYIGCYIGNSQKDDFEGLEDDYPKPSSLNMCTRYALTEPRLFTNLLKKILQIIDAGYKGKIAPELGIRRFVAPFQQWYSENIGSKSRRDTSEEMRGRRPRLALRGGEYSVALVFPEVPHCTNDAKVEFLFGTKVIKPNKQPQVLNIPGFRFPRTRQEVTYFFERDLDRSPFEKFTLRFDGKSMYRNDSKRRWKFFNENLNEIQNLSPGETFVLFEDEKYDPRTDGNINMTQVRKGLYRTILENGEEINLMGERTIVTEEGDDNLLGFNVECYEGVTADIDDVRYKIAKDLRVVYRAPTSEVFLTPALHIKVDSNPYIVLPLRFKKIRDTQVISVPQSQFPEGVHFVKLELYSDRKKIGEDEFVTMPGLKYIFNAKQEVYYEEASGRLTVEYPINKSIEFDTGDEEIYWDLPLEDDIIRIYHKVPSVKTSIDGENWMNPGTNEISIDKFIDDVIRVRCPLPIRIYLDNNSLDFIDRVDYLSFLSVERKKEINDSLEKDHIIYFSIKNKRRVPLFKLITHNDYKFERDCIAVVMTMRTRNKSFCKVWIDGVEKQITLKDGYNPIFETPPSNARIGIFEKRYGDECLIMEKYVGDPVYMRLTKEGCVVHHYENSVEFFCDLKDLDVVKRRYQMKKKYNLWMRDSRVENVIMGLFK